MNKLIIILLLSSLIGFSQKSITVVIDTVQNINWPLNLSLRQAQDSNLVKYPNYTIGRNIFTFDIINKMISIKHESNVIKVKITKYTKEGSDYIIECNNYDIIPGRFLLTKKMDDAYIMIFQYSVKKGDKEFVGFFSNHINMTVK